MMKNKKHQKIKVNFKEAIPRLQFGAAHKGLTFSSHEFILFLPFLLPNKHCPARRMLLLLSLLMP